MPVASLRKVGVAELTEIRRAATGALIGAGLRLADPTRWRGSDSARGTVLCSFAVAVHHDAQRVQADAEVGRVSSGDVAVPLEGARCGTVRR